MSKWIGLLLGLVMPLGAELDVPARPPGRVLDEARLFAQESARLAALNQRLDEIAAATGDEIYVAVFGSLIGSEVDERALALQDAWLGEAPGLVLAVEADSGRYEFGWPELREVAQESGERLPELRSGELAPQDRVRVRSLAGVAGPLEKSSADGVERLVLAVAGGIENSFGTGDPEVILRRNFQLLLLGVGLLAVMLLLGLMTGAWVRKTDAKSDERLLFPKVSVGMRLGAPSGGGKISSRSFEVEPPTSA